MYLNEYLNNIADKLSFQVKRNIYSNDGKYFSFVFLCGALKKNNDSRDQLKRIFEKYRKDIKCLYSEELNKYFSEDLLSFEELLFEISKYVVIIVESYGSACELGSFTYVNTSLDKVIVINDKKHKEDKSYINDGPIKKIRSKHPENIFFENFVYNKDLDRDIILISNELHNKLINISKTTHFKNSDLQFADDSVVINNLFLLLIIMIDIIKFFGPLNEKQILEIMYHLYKVKSIKIRLNSSNEIDSKDDYNKTIELLILLLKTLCIFGILIEENEKYYINYNSLISEEYDFMEQNSIVFRKEFVNSKSYKKYKGKIIRYLKKNGVNIWNH